MESADPGKNPLCPVKVGVAGWSYEDWKDTVYPSGLRGPDRLPFLARYFDCVEVNSTFYAVPHPNTVARWNSQTEDRPEFLFSCKLVRTLTHEQPGKGEADPRKAAGNYLSALRPLIRSKKLGALLAQFPWYFKFNSMAFRRIRKLAEFFNGLPLVVEIRHRSFLNHEFLSFLSESGVGLANIDLPSSRTSLPHTCFLFGKTGYFRFHGRNREAWFNPKAGRDEKFNYLYNRNELKPWVERIKRVAQHAERVFVIANNHYRGQAPANAIELSYLLGRKPGIPEKLSGAFARLKSLEG